MQHQTKKQERLAKSCIFPKPWQTLSNNVIELAPKIIKNPLRSEQYAVTGATHDLMIILLVTKLAPEHVKAVLIPPPVPILHRRPRPQHLLPEHLHVPTIPPTASPIHSRQLLVLGLVHFPGRRRRVLMMISGAGDGHNLSRRRAATDGLGVEVRQVELGVVAIEPAGDVVVGEGGFNGGFEGAEP